MEERPGNATTDVFGDLDADSGQVLAARLGTPVYLISERVVRERVRALAAAARHHAPDAVLAWSLKTNPLLGVLSLMREEGAWAEVVSGFEYALVRRTGVPAAEVVLNGPARSDSLLAEALRDGAIVHVDHLDELDRVAALCSPLGRVVPIGLRVDTGRARRFGLSPERGELGEALTRIARAPALELGGLHAHLGGSHRELARFRELGSLLAELARKVGTPLRWIDVGGGLAGSNPRWDDTVVRPGAPDPREYCDALLPPLAGLAPTLILEPGRTLVEPAGALLTRVVGARQTPDGEPAYVLDAGINAVPTAARHRHPVRALLPPARSGGERPTTLYGPLCMQKDRIAHGTPLPLLARGDLVLVEGTGAYDIPRAIAFSHPLPGVVLWQGGDATRWLRRPDTIDDLFTRER